MIYCPITYLLSVHFLKGEGFEVTSQEAIEGVLYNNWIWWVFLQKDD